MSDWKKKAGLGSEVLPTITSVPGTAMVPVHDDGEAKQIAVAHLLGASEAPMEPLNFTVSSGSGYNGVALTVAGGSIIGMRVGNCASIWGSVGVLFSAGSFPANFKSLSISLPGSLAGGVVGVALASDGADGAKRSNSAPIRGHIEDGLLTLNVPSDMPNGSGYLRFSGTYMCSDE